MFGMPAPTAFDLNFRVLRIPVRISPWFWLVAVMMGPPKPDYMLLWVPCVLLSILVHELGHGLIAKSFGFHPQIALIGMGGLCASGGEETFRQRLSILFGGPGAQLLLLALVLVVANLWFGIGWRGDLELAKEMFAHAAFFGSAVTALLGFTGGPYGIVATEGAGS